MAYNVELSPEALDDLERALVYFDLISKRTSTKFRIDIANAIEQLKASPQHYQLRYKDVLIKHLKTFSFGIHYVIEENVVFIQRFLHHKQRFGK